MASASSEPLGHDVGTESDRVAALEADLEYERRRREAAEEWAEFLEGELDARDQRLDAVIEQYETQLEGLQQESTAESGGLWARLTGWLPGR